MKHHILYIPGVGDNHVTGQRLLMRAYSVHGVKAEVFPMHWTVDEPYGVKQHRLMERVRQLKSEGKAVSLMGFSAGASAVINTYLAVKQDIHAVITISGIVSGSVNPNYYRKNPAFRESMLQLPDSLSKLTSADKRKMLVVGSKLDAIVPLRLAAIPGVKSLVLPSAGHAGTLIYATLVAGGRIVQFIKQQSS